MMSIVYPQLGGRGWRQVVVVALAGSAFAGTYGILHDQVTYSLSPEYFTKFKFGMFAHADFGWGDRWFVAAIGFLATWWVGLLCGWVLARVALGKGAGTGVVGKCLGSFLLILGVALVAGVLGYFYGTYREATGGLAEWEMLGESLRLDDTAAFAKVGYIHNFGYGGAVVGLVAAVVRVRRIRCEPAG